MNKNIRLLALSLGGTMLSVTAACPPAVPVFRDPQLARRADSGIRVLAPIDEARWIAHPAQGKTPSFWRFERPFVADGRPFEIDVSADERYVLLLDGEIVGRGPDRCTVTDWKYRSWRLCPAAGEHVLAAVVWQAGAAAPDAQLTNGGGFVLRAYGDLDAKLTTGRAAWLVGRLADVSFDGADDTGWGVGATSCSRGTGFLEQRPDAVVPAVIVDKGVIGGGYGGRRPGWLLSPSRLPPQLERPVCPGVFREGGEKRFPIVVAAGEKRTILWDLENYYCAYPVLETSGGRGAEIVWTWAESTFYPEPIKNGWGRKGNRGEWKGKIVFGKNDRFLPDGREAARFSPPWWRCGRWCKIEVAAKDEPVVVKSLSLNETRYPLEDEGVFACDDESLDAIARMCLRGNQMCAHDMIFDCPYYEQRMYDGDTRVQLEMLAYLTADDRLAKRAIDLLDQSRQPDGMIAMNFPNRRFSGSATFTMCWTLMLGDFAMNRRDTSWLKTRWPGLVATMEALRVRENGEGLLVGLPGWCFVDWILPAWDRGVAPDGESESLPSAINNLFWVKAQRSTAFVARVLGDFEAAACWDRRARRTAESVVARFWDESRGLLSDTVDRRSFSEHAQALAIGADVLPPDKADRAFAALVGTKDLHRATVYFSYYLFEAYFKRGRGDLFLKRLDLWRDFVKDGLKTPLESPSLDGVYDSRSDCHAWGAHPLYFMRAGLAGIRSAAPGFARVEVAPAPGPLRHVEATVPHPDGKVSVDLRFDGTNVLGRVTTPVPGVFRWQGWSQDLKKGENVIRRPQGREAVLEWFRSEWFGRAPVGRPADEVIGERSLTCADGRVRINFHLSLPERADATRPAPVFVFGDHFNRQTSKTFTDVYPNIPTNMITSRGYAYVCVNFNDVCLNTYDTPEFNGSFTNGVHRIYGRAGGDGWGSIGAWAWCFSRTMDWIETRPELDARRVAIVGLSRGGKTALWAGAQDERIALTISTDSGTGGARLLAWDDGDPRVERIQDFVDCRVPFWFADNFMSYRGRERAMPFDADALIGLIAPRHVYVASASEDYSAGPRGEFEAAKRASRYWRACGAKGLDETAEFPQPGTAIQAGDVGYHLRPGGHSLDPWDWERYLDYADRHLKGGVSAKEDCRTREILSPVRVVAQSDGLTGAGILLQPRFGQISEGRFGAGSGAWLSTNAWLILDFGRELHGSLQIGSGAKSGHRAKLHVRFGESVSETLAPLGEHGACNDHAVRDDVIRLPFMGRREIGETGFRFVRLANAGEDPVLLECVRAVSLMRPMKAVGSFRSSDERLNRIFETAVRTVHLCCQDYAWDGIKRDRLVWMGDMHPETMVLLNVFGAPKVIPETLDYVAATTDCDGWANGIPTYTLCWIRNLAAWSRYTGDLSCLRRHADYLRRTFDHVKAFVGADGWSVEGEMGTFLDWPTHYNREAERAGVQALALLTAQDVAELGGLLGNASLVASADEAAAVLRRLRPDPHGAKSSAALLALSGLRDPKDMFADVLARNGHHGVSTFYGYYMLEAMSAAGEGRHALKTLRDYWGGMLDVGATSFWEDFNLSWTNNCFRIDEMPVIGKVDVHGDCGDFCYKGFRHSLCHGWSAGPAAWCISRILGISPRDVGCRTVQVRPFLGDLSWAEGAMALPTGERVFVRAERTADGRLNVIHSAPGWVKIER